MQALQVIEEIPEGAALFACKRDPLSVSAPTSSACTLSSSGFLVHALEDQSADVRLAGIQCLRMPAYLNECAGLLLMALYDGDLRVRLAALDALHHFYSKNASISKDSRIFTLKQDRMDLAHCLLEDCKEIRQIACKLAAFVLLSEETMIVSCQAVDSYPKDFGQLLSLAAAVGARLGEHCSLPTEARIEDPHSNSISPLY